MKLKLLTALVLFGSIGLATPTAVFSQPKTGSNTYSSGYWQPQAQVNPNNNIKITLLNQSGLPIRYNLNPQPSDRELAPGATTDLYIRSISGTNAIANLNIYAPQELQYDYNTNPSTNQLFVRIRLAGNPANEDKAIYIDETGRVYSF